MTTLYTIGYGNRPIDEFIELLKRYQIAYVIDVRSVPYSRQHPDYSQKPFEHHINSAGMRYVFMGDALGGKPKEPTCYTSEGKVDYTVLKTKQFYLDGIERLRKAYEQNLLVAIMCSELRPEMCHRSKLIGETLNEQQIAVAHIDDQGELKTHKALIDSLTKVPEGQLSFFDEINVELQLKSRKRHMTSPIEDDDDDY
jgi:uncharacterized protein (DUF488 family)